jgi:hypothetical protein
VLATTYHERWELETTLDEVKVHQWAHPRPLRSTHPRAVVQEVYGWLLAHLAIRTLMYQAALSAGVDPDRLRFTGARRSCVCHPRAPSDRARDSSLATGCSANWPPSASCRARARTRALSSAEEQLPSSTRP